MPDGAVHTFYVASRLFTPEGGKYACFVIKYEGARLGHYAEYYFSGLGYEEGYGYLVRAELEDMVPPDADGVDKIYKVVETISKEKKDSENLPF